MKNHIIILLLLMLTGNVQSANYYWNPDLMVSNNWSDLNNWYTTSGGNVHPSVLPGPNDDVYFDGNTVDPFMTIDINAQCHSFIFNGPQNYSPVIFFDFGTLLEIYGSFLPDDNLELYSARFVFKSTNSGNVVDLFAPTTNSWDVQVEFNGSGGEWTFTDDGYVPYGAISLFEGKLNTNGFNIYTLCFGLYGNGMKEANLSTSHIYTKDGGFLINGINNTVDADSAFIYLMDGGPAISFNGGDGIHYHYLESDTLAGAMIIAGTNCEIDEMIHYGNVQELILNGIIHKAIFKGGGNLGYDMASGLEYDTLILDNTVGWFWENEYNLGCDSIFVNDVFQVYSGLSDTITITEYLTSNFNNILLLPDDTICLDYVKIKGIHAVGPGNYYAGGNSVDQGGNSGWIFTACGEVNGVEDVFENSDFEIYPNPTHGYSWIKFQEGISGHIIVRDVTGKIIYSERGLSRERELNLFNFPSGLYLIQLETNKGILSTKLIKE